jgi:hypothetical protein
VNKNTTPESAAAIGDAELRRIGRLEEELARVPVNSARHRELTATIHIEAEAYRKSLDAQQARATHGT